MTTVLSKMAYLAELSPATEELYPAQTVCLPTSLVYSNAADFDPEFARISVGYSHSAREAFVEPILLCAFPADTLVLANSWFTTFADGAFVVEQFAPPFREKDARPQDLLLSDGPVVDVSEPCLLVGRYGEGTWGHWLGELLPRAVLAEQAYPGRFKFVVPAWTTVEQPKRGLAHAINESLAAYGITGDRCIRLQIDLTYRFKQLFGVTSVWSDFTIHPAVLDQMRSLASVRHSQTPPASGKIALLRKGASTRNIINLSDVEELLVAKGFEILELGGMPFATQVAIFQSCPIVFSVLGSELTGLMYSPDEVKVLSAGPANWADRFFYPLVQLRDGLLADIRGPADWKGERFYREAPFRVDLRQVDVALESLSMPLKQLAPDGYISVSGLQLPLRVGKCEFAVDFTSSGNAQQFLKEGWSDQEAMHIWCIGRHSDMVIPAPLIEGDYQLEFKVIPAIWRPYIVAQKLDLRINGIFVESFVITEWMEITCRVPREAISGHGQLHLEFDHPISVSSKSMGFNPDSREVSVGFVWIRFRRRV
jgi:hypothetical protein